jgi:hypothetical protein
MEANKKLLSDHRRIKKRFYPPGALFGWTEIHYVEQILPEIVWIGYFLKVLGRKRGISVVTEFAEICFRMTKRGVKPDFGFLSVYSTLVSEDWSTFRLELAATNLLSQSLESLIPFVHCYPKANPFWQLGFDTNVHKPSDSEVDLSRTVVAELFDRRTKMATLVQSVIMWIDMMVGRLHVPIEYPYRHFDTIFGEIDSEDVGEAASHSRMHVNSSHQFLNLDLSWARYFWNQGLKLAPLRAGNEIPSEPSADTHPIVKFGRDYERYAWSLVDEIWSKLPINLYESELFEVLGALLSRQSNLAIKVAGNMDLWDYHAGPLFLRPMTDCFITVAWILKGGIERARKFILYGLGQEKLEIERLRSALDLQEGEDRQRMEERIKIQERWLESQHYAFLQYVDIGSWSGISTRKMAEEADCLDLYDFAYVGWSHAAHGTWNHIGKFDSFPSPEPLHKHLWQPVNFDHGRHVDVVVQATKYFDKVCVALVDEYDLGMEVEQPSLWLRGQLIELFAAMEGVAAEEPTVSP